METVVSFPAEKHLQSLNYETDCLKAVDMFRRAAPQNIPAAALGAAVKSASFELTASSRRCPGSYRYRLTAKGCQLITALLTAHNATLQQLNGLPAAA